MFAARSVDAEADTAADADAYAYAYADADADADADAEVLPVRVVRPALRLSLQMPDGRHRAVLPRHRVVRWIRAALDAPAEITVRIVDEGEARRLNRDYRGKDYATNVLTFDYVREPVVLADLVLCAAVVEREAKAARIATEAHYAHLLVHGALHAQGHDHETSSADAQAMEARESALLRTLGFADPYRA